MNNQGLKPRGLPTAREVGNVDAGPSRLPAPTTPLEIDWAEFFGPLSPIDISSRNDATLIPPRNAGASRALEAVAAIEEAPSSGVAYEKGSASGTTSGVAAGGDGSRVGPTEAEERSEQPWKRKRKRNRTSEMHNLTERKRRERIKAKLKELQEVIPNAHKLDRASMLDEAIAHIKSLQHHLQIMSGGGLYQAPFVSPAAMQCLPPPQFSPYSHMGPSFGVGFGMGMASVAHPVHPHLLPSLSQLPAASLPPMPTVGTIPSFRSPLPMHYTPVTSSTELPTSVVTTALNESFSSVNQAR